MPNASASTNSDSLISLSTVSAELDYIARYIADYTSRRAPAPPIPADEKARIRAALQQAQSDLNFVVAALLSSTLGQSVPVGEQNINNPNPPNLNA